jgi:predicted ATPase
MDKEITETLEVQNFLSFKHVIWEFERFNIITGDMGAGKSLCIKLLQFFEDIIPNLLIMPYEEFIQNLKSKEFFEFLTTEFLKIFTLLASDNSELPPFIIIYTFSYQKEKFEITISGKNEKDIVIESSYLDKLLEEWNEVIQKKNLDDPESLAPDGFREAKKSLYKDILNRFNNYFPIATTFVPASRAALAFGSSYTDKHLKEFKELVDFLPQFISRNQEIIDTILKAKINTKDTWYLETNDGRKVPLAKASSGQQEIVYVLMLLDKLNNFYYTYGKHHSIFIEEPSAHLFPSEQKQTLELIVQMFNSLKGNGNPVRFFITTHSPYVLNSLNNMLKKGALLKKYEDQTNMINNRVKIPYLYSDEVSAYFINNDGCRENMLDDDKKYLSSEKISNISISINNDTVELRELNNELAEEERTESG